ncbi:gamma carbonic anhydrase 1, mitochondrial [Carica papaya]|uniref:gamma carbonic anhydrase 1, mitochondrial n=1 Tax=Carica papaya TaxID=3649 RepID=UPI000B8D0DDD|nr:gamma carbonic anhydrase 1, mitochondrial [Carica papaya]
MGTLGKAVYTVGFWIRETGQALDRLGCRLQGNYYFQEQLSRHRTLMNVFDKAPTVDKDAFVAPSASIIGDVSVGRGSSIWYGCVLRGDVNSISVGSGTNIQDNSLVHVAKSNLSGKVLPTIIGDNVTVGHSAVLHGCTVEDEAFVGMGATLLDGVFVEKHAMVAAGTLVRQNTRIPCGEVSITVSCRIPNPVNLSLLEQEGGQEEVEDGDIGESSLHRWILDPRNRPSP